ncbi:MAG: M14 family metallopeptidase [Burkholderiales bacterium]
MTTSKNLVGSPDHRAAGSKRACTIALLAALLCAACSSVPLPPWRGTQVVDAQPVPVPVPGAPEVQDGVLAPPYGAAVAARFPAPAVVYNTPGLAADRVAYTSNAEIQAWLRMVATPGTAAPGVNVTLLSIGASQGNLPLEALVLTRAAATDPRSLRTDERPTVLLIGQQHGDEPASAEALLVVARELAQGLLAPLLAKINVIVMPRANPDGAAAGKRVTANGIDMNRDHLLLKTPEANALARLVREYRPMVVIDAHEYTVAGRYLEKFNAVQKYDALLQYATTANMPEFFTKAAEEWFREPMAAALEREKLTSEWYYTTSNDPADLKISMGGAEPNVGRNVNGLKNTVSMLIETRGVGIGRLHLQRRVHTQVTAISSALKSAGERAERLRKVREFVERDVASLACTRNAVLEAALTPERKGLVMLDPVTGADRTIDVAWQSALKLKAVKSRIRPCGYWVSEGAGEAIARLRLLGVEVYKIAGGGPLTAETYRELGSSSGSRNDVRGVIIGEAPIRRTEVELARQTLDAPAGSFYVPVNQPLGNLAIAALEPDSQNSYYANHLVPDLASVVRVMATPALPFEDAPN